MTDDNDSTSSLLTKASAKAGLSPGSLISVGSLQPHPTRIKILDYNHSEIEETEIFSIEALLDYRQKDSVTWVDIEGLADIEHIQQLGALFDIHPLVLEDIINTHQRPKFEEFDDYLFIVLKKIALVPEGLELEQQQFSILVMQNFVFSFSERADDTREAVKLRIRNSKGRFRARGSDYLAYALIDSVVDSYFSLSDSLDIITEDLEDELLDQPDKRTLNTIQKLKRQTIMIRRTVVPVRELVAAMLRSDNELINRQTHIYLRDVYDHSIRVIESMETFRDLISGMLDIYLSSVSNKMNEIMKVLTIFAAIFIPLTFIAGVYGMNFEYMPELKWRWGYPFIWLVFVAISILLLIFFRRRKWF